MGGRKEKPASGSPLLGRGGDPGRVAGLFLLLLTLFRLWYASGHELIQDEAYYWQWSRHLDWGYYDNTPLAALVIRAFTTLLGSTRSASAPGRSSAPSSSPSSYTC